MWRSLHVLIKMEFKTASPFYTRYAFHSPIMYMLLMCIVPLKFVLFHLGQTFEHTCTHILSAPAATTCSTSALLFECFSWSTGMAWKPVAATCSTCKKCVQNSASDGVKSLHELYQAFPVSSYSYKTVSVAREHRWSTHGHVVWRSHSA